MISQNFARLQIFKNTVISINDVIEKRRLWGYVAVAFNQVDQNRLEEVGPDRLCAEWLLKNGGAVQFKEFPNNRICDYNILPPESQKLHIKVADASNSSIMKIGLEHFRGCKYIDSVILHNCKHLEADGLCGIKHLKDSLLYLQVSACYNITDESFKCLNTGDLRNLKCLLLFDLPFVKDFDALKRDLQSKLSNCEIQLGE